jgi:hypothetical protein
LLDFGVTGYDEFSDLLQFPGQTVVELLEDPKLFTFTSEDGFAVVFSSDFPGFVVSSPDSPLSFSVDLPCPLSAFVDEEGLLADFEGDVVVAPAAVVPEAESDLPVEADCFPPAADEVDPAAVVSAAFPVVVAAAFPAVVSVAFPAVVSVAFPPVVSEAFPAVVVAAPVEADEAAAEVVAPAVVVAATEPLVLLVAVDVSFFSLLSFFSSFPV